MEIEDERRRKDKTKKKHKCKPSSTVGLTSTNGQDFLKGWSTPCLDGLIRNNFYLFLFIVHVNNGFKQSLEESKWLYILWDKV